METADALHLATAIEKRAQVFLTRDGAGKKAKKGQKKTILELRNDLSEFIDIMTPEEFFQSISSAAKQMEIKHEEKSQPATTSKPEDNPAGEGEAQA